MIQQRKCTIEKHNGHQEEGQALHPHRRAWTPPKLRVFDTATSTLTLGGPTNDGINVS
jgi:hypothetical protein